MKLPPLPPGAVLMDQPERPDPWDVLRREGFVANNGYRTAADVARIRAQGYTPASHGAHNRADGVDLDHPRLSRAEQNRRLNQLFGRGGEHEWQGFRLLDEGHHR